MLNHLIFILIQPIRRWDLTHKQLKVSDDCKYKFKIELLLKRFGVESND